MEWPANRKVIGIGLNKTGTKTLAHYFRVWGLRNRSFDLRAFEDYRAGRIDELLDGMDAFDSFEDWPWPLMWREIDRRFPDALFILTVRESPEVWFRSLCMMAVRMGPLSEFEKHIYGYAMPQGRKREHIRIYDEHNAAVEAHFRDRPGKLLKLCWETGSTPQDVADFLGVQEELPEPVHANKSMKVYGGNNLALAHLNRIGFQTYWKVRKSWGRLLSRGGGR
jgi:hypothetical protein